MVNRRPPAALAGMLNLDRLHAARNAAAASKQTETERPPQETQAERVLEREDDDYVEEGTHGQFQPGRVMDRAKSNREIFRPVKSMPIKVDDFRPRRSLDLAETLRMLKYAEPATEGQWGKDDHNWGLIRMGMDARDQERSQQEHELGHSKSQHELEHFGKSSMTQVDHAVEFQYRHRKPQGEDALYRPAYGDTGWVAERSKGSRGHFDAGHV